VENRSIRGGRGLVVLELVPLAHGRPSFIGKEQQWRWAGSWLHVRK